MKFIFIFCHYQHWDDIGVWNSLSWKTGDLCIPNSQYHCCWWPGDARSQGNRSHGVDGAFTEYFSLSIIRVYKLRPEQDYWHLAKQHFQMHFLDTILSCLDLTSTEVQLTLSQHWFRYWLGDEQQGSCYLVIWTNDDLVLWCTGLILGLHPANERRVTR